MLAGKKEIQAIFEATFSDVTMLQRTRKFPNEKDYHFQALQKLFHKSSKSDTLKKSHHELFQKILLDAKPRKQLQAFFKPTSGISNNTKPKKPKLLLSDPIDLKIVALANEIIMSVNQDAWRDAELVDMALSDINVIDNAVSPEFDADNLNFDMVEDLNEVDVCINEGNKAVGRPRNLTSFAGRQAKIYQALDILKLKNAHRTIVGTHTKSSNSKDIIDLTIPHVSTAKDTAFISSKKVLISGRVIKMKLTRTNWSKSKNSLSLLEAKQAVKGGMSVRAACTQFGIPRSTLGDHVNGKRKNSQGTSAMPNETIKEIYSFFKISLHIYCFYF